MKRLVSFLLLASLLCGGTLLSGCGGGDPAPQSSAVTQEANWVEATEWPENRYTAQIPKLEHGKMAFVLDESSVGRYALTLHEISMEQSADYLETLKAQGYTVVASEGNDVSVGTLLKRGNTSLSISYTDGQLGILIIIKD